MSPARTTWAGPSVSNATRIASSRARRIEKLLRHEIFCGIRRPRATRPAGYCRDGAVAWGSISRTVDPLRETGVGILAVWSARLQTYCSIGRSGFAAGWGERPPWTARAGHNLRLREFRSDTLDSPAIVAGVFLSTHERVSRCQN